MIYKAGSREKIRKSVVIYTEDQLKIFFIDNKMEDVLWVINKDTNEEVKTKAMVELFILYRGKKSPTLEMVMIPDEKVKCVTMTFESGTSPEPIAMFSKASLDIRSDDIDHIHLQNGDIIYHFDDPVSSGGLLKIYSLDSSFESMESTLKWYSFIHFSKMMGIGGGG